MINYILENNRKIKTKENIKDCILFFFFVIILKLGGKKMFESNKDDTKIERRFDNMYIIR